MNESKLYKEYDNEGNLIKKECSKCHEVKTVDNFYKDTHTKAGYTSQCKKCKGYKGQKILFREYDEEGNLIKLECCKCGEIKSIDNYAKGKYGKDGYNNICRNCRLEYYNKNKKHGDQRRLYKEYDNEGKLIKLECYGCGEIKTIDNFNKDSGNKDGYKPQCKECRKKYQEENKDKRKQYLKDNADKIKETRQKYLLNNKEILREKSKIYRLKNKDKIRERNRKYVEENKEKIKERTKIYRENNREKILEHQREYYKNNVEKVKEKHLKYYEINRDKNIKRQRQYYKNNKEKISESGKQYREKNKERINKRVREWYQANIEREREKERERYEEKTKQEIQRIYENVTKKLYPNNGIQYGIIYGVHCNVTDRWYIGQTIYSFDVRYDGDFFKNKPSALLEDNPNCKLLQDDIEKYGKENFEIHEVIDVAFSERELDEKEAYYIDYYKAYDEGYNSNRGYIFKHNKSKRKEVV